MNENERPYVVGVDLGGTKVEACLMDSNRQVLKRSRRLSEPTLGIDHVVENIFRVIEDASEGILYSAIGIGTPGTYLPETDTLFGVPHTAVYETPGFMKKIRDRLKRPLLTENDANCLALAEYFNTYSKKCKYVLAVILGTGMGFGLILDGKLYRGANGGAGELGHCTVNMAGRMCECGRKGCAEAYLSGSSISRRYEELTGTFLEVAEIYPKYQENESSATLLFEESCLIMGEVFANAVNALDIEAIILGGGVSNLPVWYEKVPSYLQRSLFGIPRNTIPILKAQLGDSAGVVGAAYLALRELGLMSF